MVYNYIIRNSSSSSVFVSCLWKAAMFFIPRIKRLLCDVSNSIPIIVNHCPMVSTQWKQDFRDSDMKDVSLLLFSQSRSAAVDPQD